jgi:predicted TIM-barrel fold metal-dependent hydrolase
MPVIDIHVHLAGLGTQGSGCHVSRRMRRTLVFAILKRALDLDPDDPAADSLYVDRIARLVDEAPHVDQAVLFAMDGVYDPKGAFDEARSHLFDVCRRHPNLLPGASVNPSRADAIEELERCDVAGAVLVKWLAPLQLFDPALPAFERFYRELARRRMPLLAHTGCEHTFPDMRQEYGDPRRYRRALELGVTIVFAHCGVACAFHRRHHATSTVLEMMDEFPNLYADNSALTSFLKFHHLRKIPWERYPGRFVHGSDYPIPPMALPYARTLGLARAARLQVGKNPLEVDWQIKTAIGVPDAVFEGAALVLAERIAVWRSKRDDRWARAPGG